MHLPSFHPSFYPSVCTICLYIHSSAFPSIHPSIHAFIRLSIHLSILPSICLYIHSSVFQSIHLSLHSSVYPCFHPSVCTSIFPSILQPFVPILCLETRLFNVLVKCTINSVTTKFFLRYKGLFSKTVALDKSVETTALVNSVLSMSSLVLLRRSDN